MDATPDTGPTLAVDSLEDALGIGLELAELFGDAGDFCAVWLGTDDGTMRDFVVCTEDRGRDVDRLVRYAAVVGPVLDAGRVVLWRSVDDPTDGPALAAEFFEHGSVLDEAGAALVDEIAVGTDEFRSLAISTFTDEDGWDDISSRLDGLDALDRAGDEQWPA